MAFGRNRGGDLESAVLAVLDLRFHTFGQGGGVV